MVGASRPVKWGKRFGDMILRSLNNLLKYRFGERIGETKKTDPLRGWQPESATAKATIKTPLP